MQTRASKLWLPGRWEESSVSLRPSGIDKSDFEYISIHNEFSNTSGRRKETMSPLLKSFQRTWRHQVLLSDCLPARGQSQEAAKSISFALSPEQRQADRNCSFKNLLLYFIISSLHQNLIMLWHSVNCKFPRGKGARKLSFQIARNLDCVELCQDLLCFLPCGPSELRSDVPLDVHF